MACKENSPEATKILLDVGADVGKPDKNGSTPLNSASRHGCKEVTKLLLDAGASVEAEDQDGRRPLSLACEGDHYSVGKLLLDAGAKPVTDTPETQGFTPLMHACRLGNVRLAEALLDAGENVEVVSEAGESLLHLAVPASAIVEGDFDGVYTHYHYNGMLKLILERAPFLVHRRDKEGKSPLDLAMENCYVPSCQQLG
ncbi:hypothetical protein HDU96_006882 [Phlyctochytrium bullatum]|nr:hypothetical protein HDU96_006882 [Phlyctochytrium bullatum]